MPEDDPVDAGPAVRALLSRLRAQLGDAIVISEGTAGPFESFDLASALGTGCPVSLLFAEREVIAQLSQYGGRWELGSSAEDLAFLEQLLRGVTLRGATEVRAPGRSRVDVVLPDGQRVHETGYEAARGCLPMPGWRRWGRKIHYEPYRLGD